MTLTELLNVPEQTPLIASTLISYDVYASRPSITNCVVDVSTVFLVKLLSSFVLSLWPTVKPQGKLLSCLFLVIYRNINVIHIVSSTKYHIEVYCALRNNVHIKKC